MEQRDTIEHIDRQMGLRLANNNESVMEELLSMLVEDLAEVKQELSGAADVNDLTKLKNIVHRLYGASCYCGVPVLKQASHDLQNVLREDADYHTCLEKLNNAIVGVLEAYTASEASN